MPDFIASAIIFIQRAADLATPNEVLRAADVVSKKQGLRPFCAWQILRSSDWPTSARTWTINEDAFYYDGWPTLATLTQQEEYLRCFHETAKQRGPSAVSEYLRSEAPYNFSLTEAYQIIGENDWICSLLRAHGGQNGLYCLGPRWGFLFLSASGSDPAPVAREYLSLVSVAALKRISEMSRQKKRARAAIELKKRELQVLRALSHGKDRFDIADQLDISPETVKDITERLRKKFRAANAAELVAEAIRCGAIQ